MEAGESKSEKVWRWKQRLKWCDDWKEVTSWQAQVASRNWKSQGNGFSPSLQKEHSPDSTWILVQQDPFWIPNLQDCMMLNLHCFSLWEFITAATVNERIKCLLPGRLGWLPFTSAFQRQLSEAGVWQLLFSGTLCQPVPFGNAAPILLCGWSHPNPTWS